MYKEILSLLIKYATARIDIKNSGNRNDNNIILLKNSDKTSSTTQPKWFSNHDGVGTQIESDKCVLDLELKCVNPGTLKIWLKGIDYADANNKRIPIYIDYTSVKINNKEMLKENKVVTHDYPHYIIKEVEDGEIVNLHFEWAPLSKKSNYKDPLKEKVKSLPQLSCTSFGYPVLDKKLIIRNYTAVAPPHFNTLMNDFKGSLENQWFSSYLKNKFPDVDFKINLFFVFNAHDNLAYPMKGKKVLYSLEDLNYRFLEMKLHYDKFALDYVDLAMGYDLIDNPKYMRLPFWIVRHFAPDITEEGIENQIERWNSSNYEKSEEIVAIASHDKWGVRSLIDNDINHIVDVTYSGKWKNNTSDMWNKFNNNKHDYLKQFKFNICAENLISDGYVTEKIFDSIMCDCIPLYAGGGSYFEPDVINPKAVLRWDGEFELASDTTIFERAYYGEGSELKGRWIANNEQNLDSVELFKNLVEDKKSYEEFKDQDRLLSSAPKYIIKKFNALERHFERLIYE